MLFCALLFFFLFPQTDFLSLGGTVLDTDANAAANVNVRLEQPTEQKHWDTMTLADGSFRFERLSYGTYRLTIHKDGYFDVSAEVRLETSKTVEFTLAAAQKIEQEIDVVARPEPINPESVSSENTVNDEVIQNIPYTGRQNFLNALSLMPAVVRDGSGQLHIHGSRPDQIRYQLDGMNLTDAAWHPISRWMRLKVWTWISQDTLPNSEKGRAESCACIANSLGTNINLTSRISSQASTFGRSPLPNSRLDCSSRVQSFETNSGSCIQAACVISIIGSTICRNPTTSSGKRCRISSSSFNGISANRTSLPSI